MNLLNACLPAAWLPPLSGKGVRGVGLVAKEQIDGIHANRRLTLYRLSPALSLCRGIMANAPPKVPARLASRRASTPS